MPEQIETRKRAYNSSRRRQQAEETRRRILDAARNLFLQRGYPGTTIDAIASEAGVAVETVYAAFRNKRTILSRLFDVSVVGDERPVPLLERQGPQDLREQTDQRQQIRLFAGAIREIMARVAPLFHLMRAAALTEPEIDELLRDVLNQRLEGMRFFVQAVAANGVLRDDLDIPEATDVVWTLSSPEVYRLLTVDRGWSAEQYESWLVSSLTLSLLPG